MAQNVEQTTVIKSELDTSGFAAGLRQMRADSKSTADSLAADNDRVTQSFGKATRSITDGGSAFERLQARVDPAVAAMQKLQQAQDIANRALATGRATQDQYAATLAAASQKY